MAADFIYNVSSAVIDDDELENDEGFILYFAFNRSVINPVDLARLNVGTGAILVTIEDDDGILLSVCPILQNSLTLFLFFHCSTTSNRYSRLHIQFIQNNFCI